jgi:hypothetical protein
MMTMARKLARYFNHALSRLSGEKKKEWRDVEYFDDSWINRTRMMADFLPPNVSVMDLGCGKMWLKDIHPISEYIPVDYCDRGPGTLLCDFNKKEFPNKSVDYSFVAGCLEYLENPEWFISEIARASKVCIISYCATDNIADLKRRRQFCWANDLSRADIIRLFRDVNMYLKSEAIYLPSNNIFVFAKGTGREHIC